MVTIDVVNTVLGYIGESKLSTSTGSLGQLTRSILNTAIYKVTQETRFQPFEQFLTATVTAENYMVPAFILPATVIHLYSVLLSVSTDNVYGDTFIQLQETKLQYLTRISGYSVVGDKLYLSKILQKPANIRMHALVAPTLPVSDEVDSGLPDAILPAILHTAAGILCVTYLDDPNAATIHDKVAQQLITNIRNQFGYSRGRSFTWN